MHTVISWQTLRLRRICTDSLVPANQRLREALERYRRRTSSPNTCAPWLRQDAQETDRSTPTRPVSRLS
jgi:hypothetical protein